MGQQENRSHPDGKRKTTTDRCVFFNEEHIKANLGNEHLIHALYLHGNADKWDIEFNVIVTSHLSQAYSRLFVPAHQSISL